MESTNSTTENVRRIVAKFADLATRETASMTVSTAFDRVTITFMSWENSFQYGLHVNLSDDLVELVESEDPDPLLCTTAEALKLVQAAFGGDE